MDPQEIKPETPKEEEKPRIRSLRTYQGDVQEAVTNNKFSSTTILTAEMNRKDKDKLATFGRPENSEARNKFFILVGSIMLLLGIITIVAVYYTSSNQKVIVDQQTKALIPFAQEKDVPLPGLTREGLINDILGEKQGFKLPVNSILYINTLNGSTSPADVSDVAALIGPEMPDALVRALDTKYMLGVYSFDINEPFIILTINDYALGFSGMIKWEDKMPADLGKLFELPIDTGSTTSAFTDESLRNKDLRILQDKNGNTILLYSFIDKNTLLITTNENVFNAIVDKYLVSSQVR